MPTTENTDRALRAPCALFAEDVGGWWSFKGIHVDREESLHLVSRLKIAEHVRSIVALELPSGHKTYEWSAEPSEPGP